MLLQEYTTTVTESENIWISHMRRPLPESLLSMCVSHVEIISSYVLDAGLAAAKKKKEKAEEKQRLKEQGGLEQDAAAAHDDDNDEYPEGEGPEADNGWDGEEEEPSPPAKKSRS